MPPPPIPTPPVPQDVIDAIQPMRRPIIIAHVVPDADALGAMCASALAWTTEESHAKVSLPPGSLSQRLSFLLDWSKVAAATPAEFAQADGFVVVDTAKKERCNVEPELKKADWSAGRPIVNIDHHQTNTRFGNVNWVVDDAGSTCELIYYLLRRVDRPVSPITASLLYAGIQTDTLGFSLSTTSPSTLLAAAELVARGADVAGLGEQLHRSLRQSEFDLLRVVYANTQTLADGQLAYSSASYEEIRGAGCSAADIDDQINVPRSLNGARLALLFSEGHLGKTRINFRGEGEVTVVELAARFKGGGHRNAAGAILHCGLQEAIDQVVPHAVEHLKKFPKSCNTP